MLRADRASTSATGTGSMGSVDPVPGRRLPRIWSSARVGAGLLVIAASLGLVAPGAVVAQEGAATREGSATSVRVDDPEVSTVCRLPRGELGEISGLAPSRRHPGVLWAHDDSGSGPVVHAIDATTCRVRATITLAGAAARDLEGIASGRDASGTPIVWLGDIGDNLDSWSSVAVVAFPEPSQLVDQTLAVTTYAFTYDRPHNAETLMAAPRRPRLWVATKQLAQGGMFALPRPLVTGTVMRARRVGDVGGLVTDGAVSPDGSRYVLRDYLDARVYDGLPPGPELAVIELPAQPQGEAVAWARDGRALLIASERDRRLLRVELPPEAWTARATAKAAATAADPVSAGDASASPAASQPPAATQPAASLASRVSDPAAGAAAVILLAGALVLAVVVLFRARGAPSRR
jgi:hypothetical protein